MTLLTTHCTDILEKSVARDYYDNYEKKNSVIALSSGHGQPRMRVTKIMDKGAQRASALETYLLFSQTLHCLS